MNPNTEQALNLIGQGLASIQGNLEMHNNLQRALQIVIQDLKSVPVEAAANAANTTNNFKNSLTPEQPKRNLGEPIPRCKGGGN